MSSRKRELALGALVVSLLAMYGPYLFEHARNATNRWWFHDDVRSSIFPFFRYGDAEVIGPDYLAEYLLDRFPWVYCTMFKLFAFVWDATAASKVLPYLALIATVAGVAVAAHRLSGKPAAWAGAAICLGSSFFMERMAGGTPRTFAFPVMAWALAALVYGRIRWAAAMVVIGAAFYPLTAVTLGLTLAMVLLFMRPEDRGEASGWPWKRRFGLLAALVVAIALLYSPTMIGSRKYGRAIGARDIEAYPEATAQGTLEPEDIPPFTSWFLTALPTSRASVLGSGASWVKELRPERTLLAGEILLLLVVLAWARLLFLDAGARRAATMLAASLAAHAIAILLAPAFYAPSRYVQYTLPVLAAVAVPVAAASIGEWIGATIASRRPVLVAAASWAAAILLILVIGGKGDPAVGFTIQVDPRFQKFYDKAATLPPNAMIAGWPDDIINNLPYTSKRRVWITGELMLPFHTGYVEEMRRRMRLFLDAYFATSLEPIVALRDQGVTHMVLDLTQLNGSVPGYMQPMGDWVRTAVSKARGQGYEVIRQVATSSVYRDDRLVILDLARVEARTSSAAELTGEVRVGRPMLISNVHTSLCMSATAGAGATLRLVPCARSDPEQTFRFDRVPGGPFHVLFRTDASGAPFCVEAQGGVKVQGVGLVMNPCTATGGQPLDVDARPDGRALIKLPGSNLAFDVRVEEKTVQQFPLHSGPNQQWQFSYAEAR